MRAAGVRVVCVRGRARVFKRHGETRKVAKAMGLRILS